MAVGETVIHIWTVLVSPDARSIDGSPGLHSHPSGTRATGETMSSPLPVFVMSKVKVVSSPGITGYSSWTGGINVMDLNCWMTTEAGRGGFSVHRTSPSSPLPQTGA